MGAGHHISTHNQTTGMEDDIIEQLEAMTNAMPNQIKMAKASKDLARAAANRGQASAYKSADRDFMAQCKVINRMAISIQNFAHCNL